MRIFKYPFDLCEHFSLVMPTFNRILKVEKQNGVFCMWAIVNELTMPARFNFSLYGTGHEITGYFDENYEGTIMDDPFVWHLFKNEKPLPI